MSESRIPILDLQPEIEACWGEFNEAFQRVLKAGQFIMGPDVKAFEEDSEKYLGTKHAIAMNSGTDALFIALRALGVGPGDEVITTPFTFFATAEAVVHVGAKTVFVDIEHDTFNIDVSKIEEKITKRTKAIIPVHLFGHACRMDEIMAIAKKHNLAVVEDVAQAFSGHYKGRQLGTIGEIGTYSFFPSKNLGAFGDGGMMVTNEEKIAETSKMLRVHGAKKKYYNEISGYNSRLDTLQAAFLRVKLARIEQATEGRRKAAARYRKLLATIPGVIAPTEKDYTRHSFHQYTVRLSGKTASQRDEVQKRLQEKGIETMVYYPVPVHKLPLFKGENVTMPVAEKAMNEVISLPIWPEITESTQERVARALQASLGG